MAGGELRALRDRLRAASGSDRELDARIEAWEAGRTFLEWHAPYYTSEEVAGANGGDSSPVTASIDAALALCERKLPEWQGVYMTTEWTGFTRPGNGVKCSVTLRRGIHSYIEAVSGDCPTLPLAILIALLGAMIEEETRDA